MEKAPRITREKQLFRICFAHRYIEKEELAILLEYVDKYDRLLRGRDGYLIIQIRDDLAGGFVAIEKLVKSLEKNIPHEGSC